MAESVFTVEQSLDAQARSSDSIGSPLYATLLRGLLDDYRADGITRSLLDGVTAKPVHDALPLRYLATAHLLALQGEAPMLARHYPSCGGVWDGGAAVVADFLQTVHAHTDEFRRGVHRNVQTNEVGRAGVLATGFNLIAARHGLPVAQLEIGSSAGLLSRWDRFAYDTGHGSFGAAGSALRLGPQWWQTPPTWPLATPRVVSRRGSDISPIDVSTPAGRTRMVSFLWPDQSERIERLRAALDIAAEAPIVLDAMDAGDWLDQRLRGGPSSGVATVVFHSIVWQYLPNTTKEKVRAVLAAAGREAGRTNPLLWMRMEPAGPLVADLRLTTWPGGKEEIVAEVGYHGADIRVLVNG